MAISGLVVTLSSDASLAAAARARIGADPRLTPGEAFGERLAVVAETPSVEEDRRLVDDLRSIPGVMHVDIAYVHLDECAEDQPQTEETSDAHR